MKMPILFSTLFFCSLAMAQSAGSPGSGPTNDPVQLELKCESLMLKSAKKEKQFVESWQKEYESAQSFNHLLDQIILEKLRLILSQVKSPKAKTHHDCEGCNESDKQSEKLHLKQRENYNLELSLLKEIEEIWSDTEGLFPKPRNCIEAHSDRLKKLQALRTVIKVYETSEP